MPKSNESGTAQAESKDNGAGKSKNIPIDTLLSLRLKKLTHAEIAKIVNCTPQNVTQRLKAIEPQDIESFGTNEALIQQAVKRKILYTLLERDLEKCSPYQLMGMYSLVYATHRTQTGQANQFIGLAVAIQQACLPPIKKAVAASQDAPGSTVIEEGRA